MRILHVTAQKPDSTGSGVYLAQTVDACARLGCEQAVVCGVDVSDDIELPDGVAVFPVRFNTPELPFDVCGMSDEMPYPSTRYRDLTPQMLAQFEAAFKAKLAEAVEAFSPEVIVCNHLYLVTTFMRELAEEHSLRCLVVAICHNTCLRQLSQHGLERERIIGAVGRLDLVLALHGEQRDRIVEVFGIDPAKVAVIGTGYDASVFNLCPEVGEGAAFGGGVKPARSAVYAGKVTFKKGIDSLLRSMDLLQEPASLRLCGGVGPDYLGGVLEQRMQESAQQLSYAGRLAPVVLAGEYRAAEVFVLPSFSEGLPLVVIEALACGCKVVVTDLPGLRPWIEDNIPAAPIVYVEPPRMTSVDEPLEQDLPAFEQRLADALEEAFAMPCPVTDVSALSWDALGSRLTTYCEGLLEC